MKEYGFAVTDVLLLSISVPSEYDQAIQNTEIVRQRLEAAIFKKDSEEVKAKTREEVAKITARIVENTATKEGEAEYLLK